jgi:hypothetical protein
MPAGQLAIGWIAVRIEITEKITARQIVFFLHASYHLFELSDSPFADVYFSPGCYLDLIISHGHVAAERRGREAKKEYAANGSVLLELIRLPAHTDVFLLRRPDIFPAGCQVRYGHRPGRDKNHARPDPCPLWRPQWPFYTVRHGLPRPSLRT